MVQRITTVIFLSTLWFIFGIKASCGLPLKVNTELIKSIRISKFQNDLGQLIIDQNKGVAPQNIIKNREVLSDHTRMIKPVISKREQYEKKSNKVEKTSAQPPTYRKEDQAQKTLSGPGQVKIVPERKHNIKTVHEDEESLDSLFEVPDNEILSLSEENELIGSGEENKQARFMMNADFRNKTAYKINNPHQFSKIKNDLNLTFSGKPSDNSSYVLGSRFSYDAVFDLTDNYNDNVKKDQRFATDLRDAYLDLSWGNCDFRLGNQQIVWGQAVGLFFADIVNPKDLKEYILPDLDQVRIPIPAANIEYYHNSLYLQFIFIPFPEFNEFAKSGSEFDFSREILAQDADISMADPIKPGNSLDNSDIGTRISWLASGWDLSLFYFYDYYNFPVNYRYISLNPAGSEYPVSIEYRPEYQRMHMFGHTFSKEYMDAIFKGEFIYSHEMYISSLDTTDQDGINSSDTLDWLLGADYNFGGFLETNFQLMQKMIINYQNEMAPKKYATSFSVWLKTGFLNDSVEPELFLVSSINQIDWLVRLKIVYRYEGDLTFILGADIFGGEPEGDFGRFDDNDRVYLEMLYRF